MTEQPSFAFMAEPIRLEAILERGDELPRIIVWLDGERFEKQILHRLSNGVLAFEHNGYAYAVETEL